MKSVTMKTDRLDKGKNTKKKSISVKKKDKEKKSIFNSKYLIILIVIIVIIGLVFIIKHQKTAKEEIELADLKDDALSIGEQKYLEFLWLVDGAFNDAKYKETIAVNDITIQDENKKFSCKR